MNVLTKYILFIFYFSTSLYSYSQATGYFGKKNFVDIGINVHNPFIYNIKNQLDNTTTYLNKNGELEEKSPLLNFGYAISYNRVITNNLAFGLEWHQSNFNVATFPESSFNYQIEMLGIRKTTVIPKIEFSYNNALLPIGVSNQIGFGVSSYTPRERDYIGYTYSLDDNYDFVMTDITKDNYYDFDNKSIKGYLFLYKLTMRIPINKFLLYHFGFRYTFNFVKSSFYDFYSTETSSDYILSRSSVNQSIKYKENRSLFFFDTGITIAF
jgi:hypothetical protein